MSKLLRISAFSFIVQSALWFIFALLCILCIEGEINSPLNDLIFGNSYSRLLSYTIYHRFFDKYINEYGYDVVVTGKVFEGFAFVYIFLTVAWFFLSIGVLQRVSQNKLASSSNLIKYWLVTGFLVALEDAIFTILLIVDVSKASKEYSLDLNVLMIPAIGTVLAIVSRGFTLWFINVTLLVIFYRRLWIMDKEPYRDEFETRYGNRYGASGYANRGYQQETPTAVQQPNQYVYPPAMQGRASTTQSGFEPYRPNVDNQSRGSGYPAQAPISPYDQVNRNQQAPNAPRLHAVPAPQIPQPDYQGGSRTALKNRSQF